MCSSDLARPLLAPVPTLALALQNLCAASDLPIVRASEALVSQASCFATSAALMSLFFRLSAYSAKPALAGPWGVVTYAELAGLVAKARASLAQLRLDRPTAFGLVGEHGPASTAWLLALAEAGHFVAPLAGNAAEHPARLALVNAQWVVVAEACEWKLLPRVDEPAAHPLFRRLAEQGAPEIGRAHV